MTTSELIIIDSEIAPRPGDDLSRHPAAVYLSGLESSSSRRTMHQALDTIAGILAEGSDALTFPWSQLRFQHTAAVRAQLAQRYAPATANKMLSALRGVLGAAFDLGLIGAEDYQRAVRIRSVKGETLPAGRSIPADERAALLQACREDPGPAGLRDAAMIALLYACGLRRAELVRLDVGDYEPVSGALRIHGKRRKQRLVYVLNGAADELQDWLAIRGDDPGPLLWRIRRGGHLQPGDRLTGQAVYHVVTQRAQQAGVDKLSPHDFRRTFVGDLLDAGADIVTVQGLAGHASPTTTARYDRRPERTKRQAAGLLEVPRGAPAEVEIGCVIDVRTRTPP